MVLFFTHIPFVVNHTINATPPQRLQQHPLLYTTNHTDRTFFVWKLHSTRPPHPGHSTILLRSEIPKVWFARCEWNFSKSDGIFFWKWILQPANQTLGWQYYARTHIVWRFCYKTRKSYIFDSAAVFKIYYRNWKSHSPSPTCCRFVSGSIFAIHGCKATLQFAFLNLLRRHLSTLPLLPSVLHCDRLRSGRAGLSLTGAFKLTKEPDLKVGKSKVSLDLECTFDDMVSYDACMKS